MKNSLFVLCLLWPVLLPAQEIIGELPSWSQVTSDNAGRMYITTPQGDLIRRSLEQDEEVLIYSPVKKTRITHVDVSNPLRIFLYYENLQEYVLLDRFLTETSRYPLGNITSFAGICAPALNNQLWLVDMVDFSIKKVDTQFDQEVIRIPLPQVLSPDASEFTFLKEYQNLLFLADKKSGIYLFDNMGNFLRQTAGPGVEYIRFKGSSMYYQTRDEQVYWEDIYSGETTRYDLPTPGRAVLFDKKTMWIFNDHEVSRFPSPVLR